MIAWCAVVAAAAPVQRQAPTAGVKWETLRTRFFAIHFPVSGPDRHPVNARRTAEAAARIADDLVLELGDPLAWAPAGRIQLVITDDDDATSAFTVPSWQWVVLSASAGDLGRWHGRRDWVADALGHELAHLVGHRRGSALAPLASYGWTLGGLAESGPGAVGGTLTLAPNEPYGLSEGAAELWSADVGVSHWSTARQATLRVSALQGRLLSYEGWLVGVDKTGPLDGELAYQQGYSFASWLRRRTGFDVLGQVFQGASERYPASWSHRIAAVTGTPPRTLWSTWQGEVTTEAALVAARVRARGVVEGVPLPLEAPGHALAPRAQGKWTGQVEGRWVHLIHEDGAEHWVPARRGSTFAFVSNEDAIVIASDAAPASPWDRSRLFRIELGEGPSAGIGRRRTWTTIPGTDRGRDPAVSPDGSRLAWIEGGDGTDNLVIASVDGGDRRQLTAFDDGTQLQAPAWSPDGDRIVLSMHRNHRPDLWIVDVPARSLAQLTADPHEQMDPWWDDSGIWFVSDPEGRFDVFRLDPTQAVVTQITRGVGAAATPATTATGDLLYSTLTADGYGTRRVTRDAFVLEDVSRWFGLDPDPDEAARDLAFRPPDAPVHTTTYRPWRSLLPLAVGPEIRIDLPGGRPVVLGGGHAQLRDALEHVEIRLYGLAGEDLLGRGAITWRGFGPDLTLSVFGTSDRRRVTLDDDSTRLDRRGTREAAAGISTVRGATTVGVEARVLGLDLGPVGDLTPGIRSQRGIASVTVDREQLDEAPFTGWWTRLEITAARSEAFAAAIAADDDVPVGTPIGWLRARGSARTSLATRFGPRLELEATAGGISRDVSREEELRAGGDAPGALRLGVLEPSWSLPGFGPQAISGEILAVGGARWVFPVAPHLDSGSGALHLRGIEVATGGHVAGVGRWASPGRIAAADRGALLGDLTAELRVRGALFDQRWNSLVRLAWGLGTPAATPPGGPSPEPLRPPTGPRIAVGIGTGW